MGWDDGMIEGNSGMENGDWGEGGGIRTFFFFFSFLFFLSFFLLCFFSSTANYDMQRGSM